MSKNTFNLGDYLKGSSVSKADTAQEQIEYIPLDDIDPDPDNFYSLEGLDELAGNIELVGLQQPLRVRPGPGDHVTVVSGHRRRAACLLIRDGGSHMFDGGVPCIVERGNVSREMQELRLIYANSSTRVMTSAELSKQAERVEELLYKLKDQGVEFPGRMRDHVAQAVNASKTKLARLHAIRANLKPPLLAEFDSGRINEAVAYRISQEDSAVQKDLSEYPPAALRGLTEKTVDGMIGAIKARRKPVGADPQISPPTLHKAYVDSDSLKNYLDERAEEDEKYFEMLSEVADRFLPCIAGVPSRREGIEALKREHGASHHGGSGENCFFDSSLKGLALEPERGPEIERSWTEVYDMLCTIAVARLLAKDLYGGPMRASAPTEISPTWKTGTPPKTGYYAARLEFYGKPIVSPRVLWWDEGLWYNAVGDDIRQHQIDKMIRVAGWWPLPDKEA